MPEETRNLFHACQKPWVLAEKASGQDGKIRDVFSFSTCYTDRVKRLSDNCRLTGNQVARPNILARKGIHL